MKNKILLLFALCIAGVVYGATPLYTILPNDGDTLFDTQKAQCLTLQNKATNTYSFISKDSLRVLPSDYTKVGRFHRYSPDPSITPQQEAVHIFHCWVSKMVDSVELYGLVQEKQYIDEGNILSMITIEEWIVPQFTAKITMENDFMGWGKVKDKWCLINNGVVVTTPHYTTHSKFHNGIAKVGYDYDTYGITYVTKSGNDFETEEPVELREAQGVSRAWVRDKYGYKYLEYSRNDSKLYDGVYTRTLPFNRDKTAGVYYNGKWGIIARDGSILVPLQYKHLASVKNKDFSYAAVDFDGNRLFLDAYGKVVSQLPPYLHPNQIKTDTVRPNHYKGVSVGLVKTKTGTFYRYLSTSTKKPINKLTYDSVWAISTLPGYDFVCKNRQWGVTYQGKELYPLTLSKPDTTLFPKCGEIMMEYPNSNGAYRLLNLQTGTFYEPTALHHRVVRTASGLIGAFFSFDPDTTYQMTLMDMITGKIISTDTVLRGKLPHLKTDLTWIQRKVGEIELCNIYTGQVLSTWDNVLIYDDGYVKVETKDHLSGLLFPDGRVCIKPVYKSLFHYYDSDCSWAKENSSWILYSNQGTAIKTFDSDYSEGAFYAGITYIRQKSKGKKYALLRSDGNLVTDYVWDFVGAATEDGLTPVKCADYSAYLDKNGEVIYYGVDDRDWMRSTETIERYLPINTRIPSMYWTK